MIITKKDFLILGEGLTQELGENSLIAGKKYSINFVQKNKTFCLSFRYNRPKSYFFVNGTEIIKFKVKESEIVSSKLYLGNISKDLVLITWQKQD